MPYGQIISRSFSIFWRQRALWVLGGLFVLFSSGIFIFISFLMPVLPASLDSGLFASLRVIEWISEHPEAVIAGLIAGAVSVIFSFLIGIFFYASLIAATGRADAGQPVTVRASVREGGSVFPRYFGLNVVLWFVYLVLFLLAALPALLTLVSFMGGVPGGAAEWAAAGRRLGRMFDEGFPILLFIGSIALGFLILFLISIPLAIAIEMTSRRIVLEGRGVFAAIGDGFKLLAAAPGGLLLTWLISVGLALAGGLVFGLLLNVLTGPLFIVNLVVSATGGVAATILITAVPALIITVITAAVQGIMVAYFATYWTLTYRSVMALRSQR